MQKTKKDWDEFIIDSKPYDIEGYESLGVGDIDGDGELEAVCGGGGGLHWYRVSNVMDSNVLEKGVIAENIYNSVGICCKDIDGDGEDEIVFAEAPYGDQTKYRISWYNREGGKWVLHCIDDDYFGIAHDIIFADIDQDGEDELIAISCYTEHHGLFIYKRNQEDITKPWIRYVVEEVIHPSNTPYAEGLSCGDINNDGKLEIVNGPYYHVMPEEGPYSGPWKKYAYANDFREMCRTQLLDITGNGKLDIVITDSEFMDGKLSWFENQGLHDGRLYFQEHILANDLYYSHTLQVYEEETRKCIMVAEMEKGGWDASYNYDARIIHFITDNNGQSFSKEIIKEHHGTHEAKFIHVQGIGEKCIVGKTLGRDNTDPRVQIFIPAKENSEKQNFEHMFVDRYKPYPSTDIMTADINGDGKKELICGSYWYSQEAFLRHEIPGVHQIINCIDIDNDGIDELIGITSSDEDVEDTIFGKKLVLLKAENIDKGVWKTVEIGYCNGDWPHGSVIDHFGKNGEIALLIANHSCNEGKNDYPQIFLAPEKPFEDPWESSIVAEVLYGEELVSCDVDGDGLKDIIAGRWWLKNNGNLTFTPYELHKDLDFDAARIVLADINNNGKLDIVMAEEKLDYDKKAIYMGRLVWLEHPENPKELWNMHTIDTMRSPHSLGVDTVNGNVEIYVAEHDPFYPYRNRGRAYVYSPVKNGKMFKKELLDHRFEHHDGMKVLDFIPEKQCLFSHSWTEYNYVHIWVRDKQ